MKSAAQALLGVLLAVALLYWVFHDVDRAVLRRSLAGVSWSLLVVGALLNVSHNHFRVARWGWLLRPVRPGVPYRPMFAAVMLGYLVTIVAPLRLGEFVRPALLSAKENLPLGPTMGTVLADRMLDGVAIVALFAAGVSAATFAPGAAEHAATLQRTAYLLLLVIVVGLAGLTAYGVWGRALGARLERGWAPVRWASRAATNFADGTVALRSLGGVAAIVAYSLLAWLTIALGTWIGIRAAGAPVSFAGVLVMLPMLALGVAVPTPGGAGGYHAAMAWGLTKLFGVDGSVAAGVSLLMYFAITVPFLIAGPILLHTERVSLRDLVVAAKQVKELGRVAHGAAAGGAP